jgi:hypothetical protein
MGEYCITTRKKTVNILTLFLVTVIHNSYNDATTTSKEHEIVYVTQYIPGAYTIKAGHGRTLYKNIKSINPNVIMIQSENIKVVNKIIKFVDCENYSFGALINCFHPKRYDILHSFIMNPIDKGFGIGVGIINVAKLRTNSMESRREVFVFANIILNYANSKLKLRETEYINIFAEDIESMSSMEDSNMNFIYSIYLNQTQPTIPAHYNDLRPGNLEKTKHKVIFKLNRWSGSSNVFHLKSSRATDNYFFGISGKFSMSQTNVPNVFDTKNTKGVDLFVNIDYPSAYEFFDALKQVSNTRLQLLKSLLALHDEDYKSVSSALQKSLNSMQEHVVNLSTIIFDIVESTRTYLAAGNLFMRSQSAQSSITDIDNNQSLKRGQCEN